MVAYLSLHDVCVSYGRNQVLHNISMNVEKGQIVTVIGANGAGKTTLMITAISGALPSGQIRFKDSPAPFPAYKAAGPGSCKSRRPQDIS